MQKYVVLVRTSNSWCFTGGREYGHVETYFVTAHDAEQAIMTIAYERNYEAYDREDVYEAYEVAKAPRSRIQKRHRPKPHMTKRIGPNSFCMCQELKAKGIKGSCKIHKP